MAPRIKRQAKKAKKASTDQKSASKTDPKTVAWAEKSCSAVGFYKLPPELRNMIYQQLLIADYTKDVRIAPPPRLLRSQKFHYTKKPRPDQYAWDRLNILLTSRQTFHEASDVLYRKGVFQFYVGDTKRFTSELSQEVADRLQSLIIQWRTINRLRDIQNLHQGMDWLNVCRVASRDVPRSSCITIVDNWSIGVATPTLFNFRYVQHLAIGTLLSLPEVSFRLKAVCGWYDTHVLGPIRYPGDPVTKGLLEDLECELGPLRCDKRNNIEVVVFKPLRHAQMQAQTAAAA